MLTCHLYIILPKRKHAKRNTFLLSCQKAESSCPITQTKSINSDTSVILLFLLSFFFNSFSLHLPVFFLMPYSSHSSVNILSCEIFFCSTYFAVNFKNAIWTNNSFPITCQKSVLTPIISFWCIFSSQTNSSLNSTCQYLIHGDFYQVTTEEQCTSSIFSIQLYHFVSFIFWVTFTAALDSVNIFPF